MIEIDKEKCAEIIAMYRSMGRPYIIGQYNYIAQGTAYRGIIDIKVHLEQNICEAVCFNTATDCLNAIDAINRKYGMYAFEHCVFGIPVDVLDKDMPDYQLNQLNQTITEDAQDW